ncbi:MAG: LytTR family transcriptional regulator [Mariniphaga sp.]|nr:LytTR family transcriptional regulator [Mariniphaga sp.]
MIPANGPNKAIFKWLANVEAKLPQKEFIKVHRSFIVSLAHIDSFTNEYVEIQKNQIPISRSYKNEVLAKLENK